MPVIETVSGIANYGPTAVLFTLSPDFSVQQYDLTPSQQEELPAMFTLTKSVRFDVSLISSTSSTPKMNAKAVLGAAPPMPVFRNLDSSREPPSLSTIQRATDPAAHARMLRANMASPLSSRGGDTVDTRSIDSRSSTGRSANRRDRAPSMASFAASGTTTFSTMSPSYVGRDTAPSPFWPKTASVASSSRRSKSSRLRQEVPHTPEGNLIDLFPYTRARLASLPYQPATSTLDFKTAPAQELRLQMLRIVFGWEHDIEDLIRDEIARHDPGSLNATLLSRWLGEVGTNYMSMMENDTVTGTDWMLLALSSMGNQGEAAKVMGRGFAQKLLQQGDIHTAATILLGLKDFDEAADIYISRNYFMEGILVTTLAFPDDWQRQSTLVRSWGDYVVENSQQHLAIRCFTVTGADTSMPWASPTQSPFEIPTIARLSHPTTLSPPASPEPENKQQARMTPKSSSLKLITTFASENGSNFRYPGLKTDDRTPTNGIGVTPIAESAMSPSGTPSTYLRPGGLFPRTPRDERRKRLSSIGETAVADISPERKDSLSTSEMEQDSDEQEIPKPGQQITPKLSIDTATVANQVIEGAPLTLSSARYDPKEEEATPKPTPQTAIPISAVRNKTFSNSETNAMKGARESSRARNGSRDRKPTGLHIQMPTLEQLNLNAIATGADGRTPIDRRPSTSSSSFSGSNTGRHDVMSPPTTAQSWTSSAKSPSVSGRSTDQYISSLDSARLYKEKEKRSQRSRDRVLEAKSPSKGRGRLPSEDRGRSGNRYIKPPKRSPSSPKPMSPEDLHRYRSLNAASTGSSVSRDSSPEDDIRTQSVKRKGRSTSKLSDTSHVSRMTARRMSPEPLAPGYRKVSRQRSPPSFLSPIEGRGRSRAKNEGSTIRSPSSPLPMSDQAKLYQNPDDDYIDTDPLKLVEANRQRLRSQPRSSSRKPRERGSSARREQSVDRLKPLEDRYYGYDESGMNQRALDIIQTSDHEKLGFDTVSEGGLKRTKSHRTLKKEMAARELEARRESFLARTAASIPVPTSRPSPPTRTNSDSVAMISHIVNVPGADFEPSMYYDPIDRSASAGPCGTQTPKAMRHPRQLSREEAIPSVPAVPIEWSATGQPLQELPRSMSVPANGQPGPAFPPDMPIHPAFLRQVRPSAKKTNFAPLTEIGRHRRTPSLSNGTSTGHLASIGETLYNAIDGPIIDVPESAHSTPDVIPELQHLAIPPPPPPAPVAPLDAARLSFSTPSGLGIGSIAIVMDDNSPSGTPVIEVGPTLFPLKTKYADDVRLKASTSPPLPPLPHSGNSLTSTTYTAPSPQPSEKIRTHHRGRGSVSEISSKFTRMTDRMRSTSRPRNQSKVRSPQSAVPLDKALPIPYETKVSNAAAYF